LVVTGSTLLHFFSITPHTTRSRHPSKASQACMINQKVCGNKHAKSPVQTGKALAAVSELEAAEAALAKACEYVPALQVGNGCVCTHVYGIWHTGMTVLYISAQGPYCFQC
jgi:hypothetical protein